MIVLSLLIVLLTFLASFYVYAKWKFTYWRRRGIPYHKPNFPLGLFKFRDAKDPHFTDLIREQYDIFKSRGADHFGIYLSTRPIYIPIHPELLKQIMVTNFSYFPDRGLYHNERDDPLSINIVSLKGEKWRHRRETLNPAFTSNKIKMMFDIFLNCSNNLVAMVNTLLDSASEIDIKEVTGCYTTEVIGSCVFGFDCSSSESDKSEFRRYSRLFFSPLSIFHQIKGVIAYANFRLGRFLRIALVPADISNFFLKVVKDIVEFREKNNFYRPDLMQLFIELKNGIGENSDKSVKKINNKKRLSLLELTAESFLIFNAGIQSSAGSITFCLYELAKQPDVQERLRQEINEVLDNSDGNITYNGILEMKYLGQVLDEILRLYPSLYVTSRQCVKDFKLPNCESVIEKGTLVFFPISALHRDAEYFPEPDKFDPERFSDENKLKIRPFTYLPFGEGPKYCIASRFGLTQVKLGIATLIKQFRFTLPKDSPNYKFAKHPMLYFEGSVMLKVEKIKQ